MSNYIEFDDAGDSQQYVDKQGLNPCANHARELDDLERERKDEDDWEQFEEEWNKRMDIIGQNGNTGEHYPESEEQG